MRYNYPMSRQEIRRLYDRYPFPGASQDPKTIMWRIASREWIQVVWNRQEDPRKILVAGCGSGPEAFALRRKFPKAEIVAIDLSPRSIALAEDAQKRSKAQRNISFHVGDLEDPGLSRLTGHNFDFVVCHGVLSYSAQPARLLANLVNVMTKDGALYLGVNGSEHFSVRLREALPALGINPARMRNLPLVRNVLDLCDSIQERRGTDRAATFQENLLAGDLFGSRIRNLPLADWIETAKRADLHFQSSFMAYTKLRHVLEDDAFLLLWPKTHAEVVQIVDLLSPGSFHRLLFTRKKIVQPFWEDRKRLGRLRPRLTSLYTVVFPKRVTARRNTFQKVTLKSGVVETRIDLNLKALELQVLRRCDGTKSVDEILAKTAPTESQDVIQRLLYGLYLLLILRLD
jgi:SAM-dependent methyltransferase